MNNIKKIIIGLCAATCSTAIFADCFTGPCSGSSPLSCGWYVDGMYGYSTQSEGDYGRRFSSYSGSGGAWGIDAGFKFMPYAAIEVGYTSFPDTKISAFNTKVATDTHWGLDAALKGILPFIDTGFEVFAKLGAVYVNSDLKFDHKVLARLDGLSCGSHNNVGLFIGAGGSYFLTPNFPLTIQWQRSNADNETGRFDVYSIGLGYLIG